MLGWRNFTKMAPLMKLLASVNSARAALNMASRSSFGILTMMVEPVLLLALSFVRSFIMLSFAVSHYDCVYVLSSLLFVK